jgi:hypothetical protein
MIFRSLNEFLWIFILINENEKNKLFFRLLCRVRPTSLGPKRGGLLRLCGPKHRGLAWPTAGTASPLTRPARWVHSRTGHPDRSSHGNDGERSSRSCGMRRAITCWRGGRGKARWRGGGNAHRRDDILVRGEKLPAAPEKDMTVRRKQKIWEGVGVALTDKNGGDSGARRQWWLENRWGAAVIRSPLRMGGQG